MSGRHVAVILFRNDLRLHDHPALNKAISECLERKKSHLLPLFLWDPRHHSEQATTWHYGFQRFTRHRKQFLVSSLLDLNKHLEQCSSQLRIIKGGQVVTLPRGNKGAQQEIGQVVDHFIQHLIVPASKYFASCSVFMTKEYTFEEVEFEKRLAMGLQQECRNTRLHLIEEGSTMVSLPHLPFPIEQTPDTYSQFRSMIEKAQRKEPLLLPDPLDAPTTLPPFPSEFVDGLKLMRVQDILQDEPCSIDARSAFPFQGGETAALNRLQSYLYTTHAIQSYKSTRNGLLGSEYSTKFSPWLSLGCLSSRRILFELKRYEKVILGLDSVYGELKNEHVYWVWFELLWRDYFKCVAMKYGNRLFYEKGLSDSKVNWVQDPIKFDMWCQGKTGIPFVDANMRELLETGFMSNRGRQNVASFLCHDLKMDWRLGAEWFESLLLDHDVCSNYGNWLYVAGLGNDPRGKDEPRYFNMIKQAKDYDPNADYTVTWCPELRELKSQHPQLVHTPWKVPGFRNYYPPIVMGRGWEQHSGRYGDKHKMRGNPKERVSRRK